MNIRERIESEIKLIDKNIYHFDNYDIDEKNEFITFVNFSTKELKIKLNLILGLGDGYPTNGHVWVHLPTEYFSQLSIQFNHEVCPIHTTDTRPCTRTSCNTKSWISSETISNGDGIHTLIKEITKLFFRSKLK